MYSADPSGRATTYIVGACLADVKYHALHVSSLIVAPRARIPELRRHTLADMTTRATAGRAPLLNQVRSHFSVEDAHALTFGLRINIYGLGLMALWNTLDSVILPLRVEETAPASLKGSALGLVGLLGVAAVVLGGVLLAPDGDDPSTTPNGGFQGTGAASDTFTAQAPWRLLIEDATSEDGGDDVGCDVILTNEEAGYRRTWDRLYGAATYQMQESGSFRYDANDVGCLVLPQNGDGATTLPFSWSYTDGDTGVFDSPGFVLVTVEDWTGSSTCKIRLASADDGRTLDSKEAIQGKGAVRLGSNGPARVYVQDPGCSVHVRAAR